MQISSLLGIPRIPEHSRTPEPVIVSEIADYGSPEHALIPVEIMVYKCSKCKEINEFSFVSDAPLVWLVRTRRHSLIAHQNVPANGGSKVHRPGLWWPA